MIGLPLDDDKRKKRYGALIATVVLASILLLSTNVLGYLRIRASAGPRLDMCPIWDIQRPQSFYKDNSTVETILRSSAFEAASAKKFSRAIQVDTQVYDSPPEVLEDPEYWTKFKKFHAYLEKTFPDVFETVEVTKVNTYGIVLYWKGSDKSLKPVMLAGHQDVVPVQKETLKDWTYPPFEGHFDGETVFGRGAADCKNVVVAIMETLELLVQQQFQPKRGIVVAFGFDEEVSGYHGAAHIGRFLEEKFGKDGIYAIVDEGMGLQPDKVTGRVIAVPGTGEKGYVDVETKLITPGGHSSTPPDHTSIGIMGELLYLIEKDPYDAIFTSANPTFHYMQCLAVHGGDKIDPFYKKAILRAGVDKLANSYVVKQLTQSRVTRYLVLTSQAMDIVSGGEKVNALPESVRLLTNHRVAIESTVSEVVEHFLARVVELAKKHELGVTGPNGTVLEASGKGTFHVSVDHKTLESAPVTPVNDAVWKALAGVTRHIYEDYVFPGQEPIVVAPAIMTGNTDTRHYWNLTRHIFRYTPVYLVDMMGDSHVHSVNEQMGIKNHLRLIAFFYEYLQVVGEQKD